MTSTPRETTDNGRHRPRGGQPRNANAQRHGLRSAKLPSDCKYIENSLNRFRNQLEAAIVDSRHDMSIVDAALVQSAIRHERRASLAERWLRVESGLTLEQRLGLMREAGAATDSRDRCLEKLKLDRSDTASIMEAIYRQPARIAEPVAPAVPSCDATPIPTSGPPEVDDTPQGHSEAIPETTVTEAEGAG